MSEPVITIRPGVRSGAPCIGGVPVSALAGCIWAGDSVIAAADDYGLTREQVLCACWFVAAYGLDDLTDGGGWKRWGEHWRKRWGAWALAQHGAMWRGDWHEVTDPPTRDAP